jgi:hypothetical protein
MVDAVVPILLVLGIVAWLFLRESNKSSVQSLDSSGCGCILGFVLLIFVALMYVGAKYGG